MEPTSTLTPDDIINEVEALTNGQPDRESLASVPESIEIPLQPVEVCTPEMLPDTLRDWLVDCSERMNSPIDFFAVASLSMIGSVIGSRCGVRPKEKDDWTIVANLWGGIVAPPSSKKSPSISEVMKPLKSLDLDASKLFNEEMKHSRAKLAILEKRKQTIINESKKKESDFDDSVKQLTAIENEIEEATPVQKRYIVNDTTPEKLMDICVQNPEGVLVLRDELSGLIRSWDKPGNETARSMYLEGWNGSDPFTVDRIIRGTTRADTFCLTVFGGIQPEKLQSLLFSQMINGENDGIMQRFQLLVYPDTPEYSYPDRYPDAQAKNKAYSVIQSIAYADEYTLTSWGAYKGEFDSMPYVKFSVEARELFEHWYEENHIKATSTESSQYEHELLSKYPKLMAGLSLIFHFVDCASGHVAKQIQLHNVQRAYLWCNYLHSHARRISGLANRSNRSAYLLSKKISSGIVDDEFTPRIIAQKCWEGLSDVKSVKDAIDILVDANWLTDVTVKPETGRPSIKYRVNPLARNWYKK